MVAPPQSNKPLSRTLRNLPEVAFGTYTLRNLPPEPTPAHAAHRNSPELSRTCLVRSCLRNLQHLRNLPPERAPDPHRHTPELIWAEDPISLRCWGTNSNLIAHHVGGPTKWVTGGYLAPCLSSLILFFDF